MRKLLFLLLLLPIISIGQVINPTPDMVFKGQLGAGRGVATDPSAYLSVGPTSGSVRGVVFPRVSDTNAVVNPRRNGLFIWSLQKSRFLYWDSVAVRWKEIPDVSNIDTSIISTRAWRQKGIDSVSILISGKINGTKNYIAKFIAPDSIGNSLLFDNGNNVGYGTITPANVSGYRYFTINGSSGSGLFLQSNATDVANVYGDLGGLSLVGRGDRYVNFWTNGNERMRILGDGTVRVNNLSGSGTRIVTASLDGTLSASSSSLIIDTAILSTRAWRQKGDDSLGFSINQRAMASRNLSINGVQYDLTADRSWSVGTVTSVGTGYGLNGGPINTTGTIQADSAFITSRPRLQKVADSLSLLISNAGGGTVTSVSAGTGMSFPTITSSGSVSVDTVSVSTRGWRQKGIDSVNLTVGKKVDTATTVTINGTTQSLATSRAWSVGTVTSVAQGVGMNFSTITGSGVVNADTVAMATRAWRQKGIDSVASIITNLNYDTTLLSTRAWRKKGDDSLGLIMDTKTPLSRTLTINGTAQTLSADRSWSVGTVTSVGSGYGLSGGPVTNVGSLSADTFAISTRLRVKKVADSLALLISSAGGGTVLSVSPGIGMSFPTITSSGSVNADTTTLSTRAWRQKGNDSLGLVIATKVNILDTASMLLPYVRHAGNGLIKSGQAFSVDTTSVSTRAWRKKGDDSLAAIIATKGNGTVTSVTAGAGLTGGVITTTGTVALDTVLASTRAWRQKGDDSLGAIVATKEPIIPAGTTAQYWRGDKSWQTLNTTVVPEGTNLYYTDLRSRSALSLTTTGTSGAATYTSSTGVFNVPNYTLAGLGGVPTTRTITINGTSQDLSTNRTWNVGTVTGSGDANYMTRFSSTGTGIVNSQMYDNGTRIGLGTEAPATRLHVVSSSLLGSTLSPSSAVAGIASQIYNGDNAFYYGVNSSSGNSLFTGSGGYNSFLGSGSNYGLDLGTNSITRMSILPAGQVKVNNLSGTGVRMVVADADGLLSSQPVPSGVAGSGTVNYIAKWTPNGTTLNNSLLFDNGTNIGIGTTTFGFVTGTGIHMKRPGDANIRISAGTNTGFDIVQDVAANVFAYNRDNAALILGTQNVERLRITGGGNIHVNTDTGYGAYKFQVNGNAIIKDAVTISNLSGTGTRMVVSDAAGLLSTQAIPSGGGGTVTSVATGYGLSGGTITTTGTLVADTFALSTRLRLKKVADSISLLISSAGGGTVLSVSAGTGMSFPTITSSGAVNVDTVAISTRLWRQKGIDSVNFLVNQRVRISDTASMLSPYLRKSDTLSLSNRINLKVNISDTATMLLPYVRHAGYGLTKIPTDAGKSQGLGTDTALISTRAWRQKGIDSLRVIVGTKVDTTRTITINGNTQTLSANRSWSVGTVTSVSAGVGMSFSTITSTGVVNADTSVVSTKALLIKKIDSVVSIIGDIPTIVEDTIVPISPFKFLRDSAYSAPLNRLSYIQNSNGRKVVTLNAVAYIPWSSWNSNGWNIIAELPSNLMPDRSIVFNGNQFFWSDPLLRYMITTGQLLTGSNSFVTGPTVMVTNNGNIVARGSNENQSLLVGTTPYICITINITYYSNYLP